MAFDSRSSQAGDGDELVQSRFLGFGNFVPLRSERVFPRRVFSLHYCRWHFWAPATAAHGVELETFLDRQRACENAEEIDLTAPTPGLFPAAVTADHPLDLVRNLITA